MSTFIEKVASEPVRVRLYTLAVLVLGYLKIKGYIDATDAEFIATAILTVLAVETARAKVEPLAKQRRLH